MSKYVQQKMASELRLIARKLELLTQQANLDLTLICDFHTAILNGMLDELGHGSAAYTNIQRVKSLTETVDKESKSLNEQFSEWKTVLEKFYGAKNVC